MPYLLAQRKPLTNQADKRVWTNRDKMTANLKSRPLGNLVWLVISHQQMLSVKSRYDISVLIGFYVSVH